MGVGDRHRAWQDAPRGHQRNLQDAQEEGQDSPPTPPRPAAATGTQTPVTVEPTLMLDLQYQRRASWLMAGNEFICQLAQY